MTGRKTLVEGASRTDAGVHALGQVAIFDTDTDISADGFRRGMNSNLPKSIAIVEAEEVDQEFHARFSAKGKHYFYQLLLRPDRSPVEHPQSWHCPRPLDLQAMKSASSVLIGEHDFESFRSAGCGAQTTNRQIVGITFEPRPHLLRVHVFGNAFLRNMVRILVGTLVDVGHGRITKEHLARILESRDRTKAGVTAPAHGLFLKKVFYSSEELHAVAAATAEQK